MRGYLALKDIGVFSGEYFGWEGSFSGEIVFFRSRSFCWDVLTDPAYHKKIVITDKVRVEDTSPFPDKNRSFKPHLSAIIFLGPVESNPKGKNNNGLRSYLQSNRIGGFIPDRRDLLYDALAFVSVTTAGIGRDPESAEDAARKPAFYEPGDFKSVSVPHEYLWDLTRGEMPQEEYNIIVWDFGTSFGLLESFRSGGCKIRVVPPDIDPEDIVAMHPDGIIISGSPVSDRHAGNLIPRIERILGIRPLLGVGGGAITLAMTIGAEIENLSSPHHGSAIAVERLRDGLVSATYQTHSTAPRAKSLEGAGCEISHINVCDGSVEGFINDDYRAIGSLYTDVFKEKPGFLTDFGGLIARSIISV